MEIIRSSYYYFENDMYVYINFVFLVLLGGDVVWLAGATFGLFKMPVIVHLIPIFMVVYVFVENSAFFKYRSEFIQKIQKIDVQRPPADRALAAMISVREFLQKSEKFDCSVIADREVLNNLAEKHSGFRWHGVGLKFKIIFQKKIGESNRELKELEENGPGTIYVSCLQNRKFEIRSIGMSGIPTGEIGFFVDGVGKPIVLNGLIGGK